METMNRYPLDKFPAFSVRPEVIAKHEEHLSIIMSDIERYGKVGHRDQSMYDWLLRVFENCGLSTVEEKYVSSLAIVKTRLAMFVVLIDDTVDNAKNHHFKLFEELIKIPFDEGRISKLELTQEEVEWLEFGRILWKEVIDELKAYPQYEKYRDAFEFDWKQLVSSMDYSKFVNGHPNAVNLMENDAYVHHGMMVLIQVDMDLMCSLSFNDHELGMLRELTYISQKMAKLGNLLGTYPRELVESDMSSEALAKFQKDFGNDFDFKLNKLFNREHRYPKFEKKIIQEWQKYYEMAKEIINKMKSIDGERFLQERELIQEAYKIKADSW